MPILPYVWGVKLLKSDGTARANVTIQITNNRTEETQTGTTNSGGQVIFDLANFTNGYIVGDIITTEKYVTNDDMEYFITANGNETNPSWIQVEDDTRTQVYPNSTRIKLNTSRNPGGKIDLKITLN